MKTLIPLSRSTFILNVIFICYAILNNNFFDPHNPPPFYYKMLVAPNVISMGSCTLLYNIYVRDATLYKGNIYVQSHPYRLNATNNK